MVDGSQTPVAAPWRWMLGGAALYNWVVALPVLLTPGAGPTDRVVAVLVAGFGLLYALVARQPARLAPALWAGVLGKLGVLWVMVPEVQAGRAMAGTGAVLAGDLLFTLGFLAFLLARRRAG